MKRLLIILLGVCINIQFIQAQAPINIPDNTGTGNCLEFDGVNDYINIPNSSSLDITGDMTIQMWVNQFSGNVFSMLMSNRINSDYTAPYQVNSVSNCCGGTPTNPIIHFALGGGGTTNTIASSNPFNLNEWTNISCTVNSGTMTVFINGEQSGPSVSFAGTRQQNNEPLLLAYENSYPNRLFNGQIDDVRIWNRALTQTEIKDNMCKKMVGNEAGLVSYWNMNEGTGNTVNDLTSNANHGTRQ